MLPQVARAQLHPGQDAFDLGLEEAPGGPAWPPGVIVSKGSAVSWDVLTSAYAELGFEVHSDEAFKQLVLALLVEPMSTSDSVRVLEEIGVTPAGLRTFFRALARAH